ncbi:MAG TPA: ABC transporter ATP-binding protein [Desulfobacterales bacterium]|nr:ABC transporter ATP-binding protein [Desulfobacterales bacterium]
MRSLLRCNGHCRSKLKIESIVTAKDVSRTFFLGGQPVKAIDTISLEVGAGEFLVLKGKSGSGKSTLLSLIAGLDRPTSGMLEVSGINLTQLNPAQLAQFRQKQIGMIFQSFNLLPTLSVIENIALPALLAGVEPQHAHQKAGELLQLVQLEHRADHNPSEISGGEMQHTAIARALVNDPALIVADEPTGNLDTRTGGRILSFIKDLNLTSGRTVIMATHSTEADAMAHRILYLRDGRITRSVCEG